MFAGWPGPVLRRSIPDADRHDLIGAWPYATTPADERAAQDAFEGMRDSAAVTFQALARPDRPIDATALQNAGFQTKSLKTHHVRRPDRPARPFSARTRANLARAQRHWRVAAAPISGRLTELCAWHAALAERRQLRGVVALPAAHFERVAQLEGFVALWAEDAEGPGACLIVAECADRIHFHTIAGAARAYRTGAFYALYLDAVTRWAERTLYFGGAPSGPDGAGIGRFKARFANDTVPIQMITAVLDPVACERLTPAGAANGWFPPYRAPRS